MRLFSLLFAAILAAGAQAETNSVLDWSDKPLDGEWILSNDVFATSNVFIGDATNWFSMTNAPVNLSTPDYSTDSGMTYGGRPVGADVIVLTNEAYLVGYSETNRCPLWVAYKLVAARQNSKRPEIGFKVDKRTKAGVRSDDYTNTGYDRGHMAPSYGIGECHGTNAQIQTFLMSNIIPQKPDLNRKNWRDLEVKVMAWAMDREELWVVTGPVFIDGQTNHINDIRVPDGCYKVLLDEGQYGWEALAFLMPQSPLDDATLGLYMTSVDEVERQTGLDFFSELPDDIEDKLERGTW